MDITQCLLSQEADASIKNADGETPLGKCQNHTIVNLIAKYNQKQGEHFILP